MQVSSKRNPHQSAEALRSFKRPVEAAPGQSSKRAKAIITLKQAEELNKSHAFCAGLPKEKLITRLLELSRYLKQEGLSAENVQKSERITPLVFRHLRIMSVLASHRMTGNCFISLERLLGLEEWSIHFYDNRRLLKG